MGNRFELINEETITGEWKIYLCVLRDKQTGIMYLADHIGNAGGLTPLINKDGKPICYHSS